MRVARGWPIVAGGIALAACRQERATPIAMWHDETPAPLFVTLDTMEERSLARDSLRMLPAPPVRFPALVQPDRHHVFAVLAPDQGVIVRTRSPGDVVLGDTLAVVELQGDAVTITPVLAPVTGRWAPRPASTEPRWVGDTLGTLTESGHWLAVGAVEAGESREIHVGDPARVRMGMGPYHEFPGRVERVHRAENNPRNGAEIAVDFRGPERAKDPGPAVEVTVTPTGPSDSVLAAPRNAVTQLSVGPSVFLPVGGGRYEVRFVFTGPHVENLIVLRAGVDHRLSVIVQGHELLARLAEESLAARGKGRP